ncbi:hypothetical protein L1987_56232 [Smallanthus sonchifolius]|uniref:Uncharacterized protein n=1 Tax=Smallanthus sonchifolius TaxID=185202 RepID=A0ACB9EC84_9ASTR|nr:hypothetical protein L1987_56232 [Smallanthus sonchifolius]
MTCVCLISDYFGMFVVVISWFLVSVQIHACMKSNYEGPNGDPSATPEAADNRSLNESCKSLGTKGVQQSGQTDLVPSLELIQAHYAPVWRVYELREFDDRVEFSERRRANDINFGRNDESNENGDSSW